MRKHLFAAIAAMALVASVAGGFSRQARADAPYVFNKATFTANGSLPIVQLRGASSCVYTITGTGTATPKGSSDGGTTYATISNAGFGAITSGIAGGALIPASGTPVSTNFYVAVSGVSGSATVTETCSGQVARVNSGGGGGGVTSVLGDACVTATPSTGTVQLTDVCTPGPQATPSPSASTGISITGSWPYTFAATGGGGGVVLSTPSPSPSPMATISPPNAGYLAVTQDVEANGFLFNQLDFSNSKFWRFGTNDPSNSCPNSHGGLCLYYGVNNSGTVAFTFSPSGLFNGAPGSESFLSLQAGGRNPMYIAGSQGGSNDVCEFWAGHKVVGIPASNSYLGFCNLNSTVYGAFSTTEDFGVNATIFGLNVEALGSNSQTPVTSPTPGDIYASSTNATGRVCEGGNNGSSPSWACNDWNITKSGAWAVSQPIWATSTANKGEVTCTTSSSPSCTTTATVLGGATCTATMETADSTLAGPYYAPSVDLSGTTLTVTMTALAPGSANLAAEYHCL